MEAKLKYFTIIIPLWLLLPLHAQVLRGQLEKNAFSLHSEEVPSDSRRMNGEIDLDLPAPSRRDEGYPAHIDEAHGELPIGVLGVHVIEIAQLQGVYVETIYPRSKTPTDRINLGTNIIRINGMPCTLRNFANLCRGQVGSWVVLTIRRGRLTEDVLVQRTDSRLFLETGDPYFNWAASGTKRW